MNAIAACEWIFGGRRTDDVLALLREAGYDGIEVNGEPARDAEALANGLAAAALQATGTTAICNWPTDERDLAHPERDARRRAVAYFQGCAELAAAVGAPVVGVIPAAVGRLEALTTYEREWGYAVEGVREVARHAGERGVRVGVEAINRYETHLVNRVDQALELAAEADVPGTGVIADLFHMQLEEADSVDAVTGVAPRLLSLHVADSNRLGLGRGQLDVLRVVEAANTAGYDGPLTLECTAPGPNPFAADKGPEAMALLDRYVHESVDFLRRM